MPFTVSHVAAVLPLHRPLVRWRVFTAAVIGSMVPDFGLLWPMQVGRMETHSMLALLTFCLPVGLVTYWLTLLLVKPAMLEALPDRAYARLPADDGWALFQRWQHWAPVIIVILFGAVTHLAWDLFTHEDSRGTRWFPVLNVSGPEVNGHALRLTRWLQYASSGLGLLMVLLAFAIWWWHTRRVEVRAAPRRLKVAERVMWLGAYALVPLAFIARDFIHGVPKSDIGGFVRHVAIDGMRWTAVGLLLVSVLLRLRLTASAR